MVSEFRTRHDRFLIAGLSNIPGLKVRPGERTFYAFPNIEGLMQAVWGRHRTSKLCERLLSEANVAPRSGFSTLVHQVISAYRSPPVAIRSMKRFRRIR